MIAPTIELVAGGTLVTWNLSNDDEGNAVLVAGHRAITFQNTGNLSGGDLRIDATIDGGSWESAYLERPNGSISSLISANDVFTLVNVLHVYAIKPRVSGGDVSTNITVSMLLVR